MKKLLLLFFIFFAPYVTKAQNCEELIKLVKSGYGTTYSSPLSDAISKVTFYNTTIDYKTYNFAIVCFKAKYSYGCTEYIYQVGSNSKMNYSMNYFDSAGKAFWNYIQPYHENLDCSPDLG
jgi:hypothetical protein